MSARVLWPERESLYDLMMLRATIGPAAFASEKQNDPMNPELCEWDSGYFDYDGFWFEHWPDQDEVLFRVLSLDPSKGKSDKVGDYSAFVKLALGRNGCIWIDADLQRRPTSKIAEDGIGHYRTFKPQAFVIEVNQFQELLVTEFKRASEPTRLVLPVWGIDNRLPKEVRIRTIGPYLAQRKIRIKANSAGARMLVQQLKDFPIGDHDDGPDALEMGIRMLRRLLTKGASKAGDPKLLT